MLAEAKQKRKFDQLKVKEDEKKQVEQLKTEIADEQESKRTKKQREREQAWKVIKANELEKAKKNEQKKIVKANDARAIEYEIKAMEAREKKRLDEIKKRGDKISSIMNRFGDQIVHKDKDMQRQQEREYIQQCIEKDEEAAL